MPNKTAQTTLEKFRAIILANGNIMPKEMSADNDGAFVLLEQEITSKGDILRRKNMQTRYSLTDWSGALRKAPAAYNDKSHSYLMGSAPSDVKGSAELQYELDKQNGEQIKHNSDKWRTKAGKLRDAGAFRVPRPRETWERIDQPKFSGKTFSVEGFQGSDVESGGKTVPVKSALSVPAGSADVSIGIQTGPGGGRRTKQREICSRITQEI